MGLKTIVTFVCDGCGVKQEFPTITDGTAKGWHGVDDGGEKMRILCPRCDRKRQDEKRAGKG